VRGATFAASNRIQVSISELTDHQAAVKTLNVMTSALTNVVERLSFIEPSSDFDGFIENLNKHEMEWYDAYRTHIASRIENSHFDIMFGKGMKTLLPLQTLAAMHILADGFGWDDARVVNECRTDLRVRHALAISDPQEIPTEHMLNNFRTLVSNHLWLTGTDLMETLINDLTANKGPVKRLGSGRVMLWATRVA